MTLKQSKKYQREQKILWGLIELYLKTGKPVGSNSLKESGFNDLSSATIRNYFSSLEDTGYLLQQHSSGGRIPTEKAFRYYAKTAPEKALLSKKQKKHLEHSFEYDGKEIVKYLKATSENLSSTLSLATFISSPRFDQDFITDIKLISINAQEILAVVITSFGMVHTEIFPTKAKLSNFSLKRIESYLHFRMTGLDRPELGEEEKKTANELYQEVALRHIVSQSTFLNEDITKTGFSKLLSYPELCHAKALANCLSVFENPSLMENLIETSLKDKEMKIWIGEDLKTFMKPPHVCSMVIVPYFIHQKPAGVIGLIGPMRMPYHYNAEILKLASNTLSETLSKILFKHQITYRMPESKELEYKGASALYLSEADQLMLEDRSNNNK